MFRYYRFLPLICDRKTFFSLTFSRIKYTMTLRKLPILILVRENMNLHYEKIDKYLRFRKLWHGRFLYLDSTVIIQKSRYIISITLPYQLILLLILIYFPVLKSRALQNERQIIIFELKFTTASYNTAGHKKVLIRFSMHI